MLTMQKRNAFLFMALPDYLTEAAPSALQKKSVSKFELDGGLTAVGVHPCNLHTAFAPRTFDRMVLNFPSVALTQRDINFYNTLKTKSEGAAVEVVPLATEEDILAKLQKQNNSKSESDSKSGKQQPKHAKQHTNDTVKRLQVKDGLTRHAHIRLVAAYLRGVLKAAGVLLKDNGQLHIRTGAYALHPSVFSTAGDHKLALEGRVDLDSAPPGLLKALGADLKAMERMRKVPAKSRIVDWGASTLVFRKLGQAEYDAVAKYAAELEFGVSVEGKGAVLPPLSPAVLETANHVHDHAQENYQHDDEFEEKEVFVDSTLMKDSLDYLGVRRKLRTTLHAEQAVEDAVESLVDLRVGAANAPLLSRQVVEAGLQGGVEVDPASSPAHIRRMAEVLIQNRSNLKVDLDFMQERWASQAGGFASEYLERRLAMQDGLVERIVGKEDKNGNGYKNGVPEPVGALAEEDVPVFDPYLPTDFDAAVSQVKAGMDFEAEDEKMHQEFTEEVARRTDPKTGEVDEAALQAYLDAKRLALAADRERRVLDALGETFSGPLPIPEESAFAGTRGSADLNDHSKVGRLRVTDDPLGAYEGLIQTPEPGKLAGRNVDKEKTLEQHRAEHLAFQRRHQAPPSKLGDPAQAKIDKGKATRAALDALQSSGRRREMLLLRDSGVSMDRAKKMSLRRGGRRGGDDDRE